jgi:hypothetical protein
MEEKKHKEKKQEFKGKVIEAKFTEQKKEAWESGIKILKQMEVIVPLKLLLICNQIAGKVKDESEFSIVTNIAERDDETLFLSEEFYIPKQIVAHTSIDYLPDEKDSSYKVVIHRHPDGCNSFSGTDQSFINQNFELSLLYTKKDGFVHGIYNLKYNNFLIQIPCTIIIDYGLEEVDISNIQYPERLMIIDKPKNLKSRRSINLNSLDAPSEWNSEKKDTMHNKRLTEENLDYDLMKRFMLEEVSEQLHELEYRVGMLEEETIFSGSNSGSNFNSFREGLF